AHDVGSEKPFFERQMRVVKDRIGRLGKLVEALRAFKFLLRLETRDRFGLAARAGNPVRPARATQVLSALLFGGKRTVDVDSGQGRLGGEKKAERRKEPAVVPVGRDAHKGPSEVDPRRSSREGQTGWIGSVRNPAKTAQIPLGVPIGLLTADTLRPTISLRQGNNHWPGERASNWPLTMAAYRRKWLGKEAACRFPSIARSRCRWRARSRPTWSG